MQIINVALGGTIIQALPPHLEELHAYNEKDQVHETHICPNTILYTLYGGSFITNSAHHQAIDNLGQNLIPMQYSFDGILEACYHTTLPIIGVQWHPERMWFIKKNPETGDGSLLLHYFNTLLSKS